MDSLGSILKAHLGVSEGKFKAKDAAGGLPEKNPKGGLQCSPVGVLWVLKGPPEGFHSPGYLQGFSTDPEELKSNKQMTNIKTTVTGANRVYCGEYT